MLRILGLVLLWLVCYVLAISGGWDVMWTLTYALGILLVGGFIWAQITVSGLEVRRRHRSRRIQVGERFAEQIVLEARNGPLQWWPRLFLEIHDGTDLPGHRIDRVASLGALGRRVWELSSRCTRRGRFTLGPIWVSTSDPFGIFRASRLLGEEQYLVVYPRTVPLPRFRRVPGELPGGVLQGTRAQVSTPNVTSVRDYLPGDAFNRIHWPSTARMNKLMVREFELDPSADIWLVLDLGADVQAGVDDDATEETAVTVVASLARHFLNQGRSVGLVSQTLTLPPGRGPRQLERILEMLAIVRATSHIPLHVLLTAETARFSRSSTLVVITPTTSDAWVSFLQTLAGRGIHSAAVVVQADTFGVAPSSELVLGALAGAHVPTYVVQRGAPLEQALSAPWAPGAVHA